MYTFFAIFFPPFFCYMFFLLDTIYCHHFDCIPFFVITAGPQPVYNYQDPLPPTCNYTQCPSTVPADLIGEDPSVVGVYCTGEVPQITLFCQTSSSPFLWISGLNMSKHAVPLTCNKNGKWTFNGDVITAASCRSQNQGTSTV